MNYGHETVPPPMQEPSPPPTRLVVGVMPAAARAGGAVGRDQARRHGAGGGGRGPGLEADVALAAADPAPRVLEQPVKDLDPLLARAPEFTLLHGGDRTLYFGGISLLYIFLTNDQLCTIISTWRLFQHFCLCNSAN